jgi:enoyl-CoA hydratase/carnithine racemase
LVGRSRAIEIVLGGDDFDADTAEKYGWINRAIPETELDDFVNRFVRRVLSFDGHALATAKQRLNQTFLPDPGHLQATGAAFVEILGSPAAAELMSRGRDRGLNTASPFELDLGRAIADLSK